jgi:hypothetical protein
VHVTDCAVMCVSAGFREALSANVFPMVSGSRKVQAKPSSPHRAIIAPIAQLTKDASSAAAIIGGTAPPRIPPDQLCARTGWPAAIYGRIPAGPPEAARPTPRLAGPEWSR